MRDIAAVIEIAMMVTVILMTLNSAAKSKVFGRERKVVMREDQKGLKTNPFWQSRVLLESAAVTSDEGATAQWVGPKQMNGKKK